MKTILIISRLYFFCKTALIKCRNVNGFRLQEKMFPRLFFYLVFISCFQFSFFNIKAQCSCSGTSVTVTNPSLNGTAANMPNTNLPTSWSNYGTGSPDLGNSSSTTDCQGGYLSSSCDGGSFARLIANTSGFSEGISQTISGLTIGKQYNVTFSQALVLHWGRSSGQVDVTFCGSTLSSPTIAVPASEGITSWSTVTIGPFTATATSETLAFTAVSNGGGTAGGTLKIPPSCNYNSSANATDLLIDGVSICEVVTTPVTLIEFGAKRNDDHVDIFWVTEIEINNDYFTVEKSIDGRNFEKVMVVDGHGNSLEKKSYSSIDTNPYEGLLYYRLKQTDFDGKYEYSKIVPVKYEKLKFELYPNPAKESVTIELNDQQEIDLKVFNAQGKEVMNQIKKVEADKIVLNTSMLLEGLYYVHIATENNVYTEALMVGRKF